MGKLLLLQRRHPLPRIRQLKEGGIGTFSEGEKCFEVFLF
jgi:hypothetical protein